MELMDKSLHQLYKLVYEKLKLTIPEKVIGKMAEAVGYFENTEVRFDALSTHFLLPPADYQGPTLLEVYTECSTQRSVTTSLAIVSVSSLVPRPEVYGLGARRVWSGGEVGVVWG